MSLIGHMVVRNEKDRYLRQSLAWLAELTDGRLLVYDDQSTDGTAEYVYRDLRLPLVQRSDTTPSFAADESAFRSAGWQALETAFEPTTEDWILVIDADEFLVTTQPDGTSADVAQLIEEETDGATSVTFPVAEIFGLDDDWPLIRADGYWPDIKACRLVRWRPGATFRPRKEGGGSVPSNWPKPRTTSSVLTILHYGYATAKDRATKFERYHGSDGHNPLHVRSIRTKPTLVRWRGMSPPMGAT